jgi:chitinase
MSVRSRRPAVTLVSTVTAVVAAGAVAIPAAHAQASAAPNTFIGAAPYEYFGWGNPQDPAQVMAQTGIRWFTVAFILSDGGCNPKWDGERSLTSGVDATNIGRIRAGGGDVVVSFGGWAGKKLGEKCTSAAALADAYQKVIDAHRLKAIDIDIEDTEFHSEAAQQRVVDALKLVKSRNAGIKTYLTIGTEQSGPDSWGVKLIKRGAAAGLDNDGWVIMPFEFGGGTRMAAATRKAAEGLKNQVKTAYGYTDDQTYRHIGISSMNGKAGAGEKATLADFRDMLAYAQQHHLARFTYWAVNRDRPCGGANNDGDSCASMPQQPYDYTKVIAEYTG